MNHYSTVSRRGLLRGGAFTGLAAALSSTTTGFTNEPVKLKGNVKHSVCKWCYNKVPLEELCVAAKNIGITSIELVDPEHFDILKKHGMQAAMISFPSEKISETVTVGRIEHGFNNPAYHDKLIEIYQPLIVKAAEFGAKNVICFSGNRNGMSDEDGLKNCAAGLKRLLPFAEKHGITLVMELLNSRINHKDYMCDKSAWGVALCKEIGSENFKLLYDIYHMQIMEGDIINTIRRDHQYFAHYHTAGNPGRHELDENQELNYPAIMRAIVDTGYTGYIGHEFSPTRGEPFQSLREAVEVCDV